ncbi:MAG: PBP1A family penicillin-binding protein [Phenylobacterium sp.]
MSPVTLSPRRLRVLKLVVCITAAVVSLGMGGALLFQQAFLADLPTAPDDVGLWGAGRPAGTTFVDSQGRLIAHRGPRHGAVVRLRELPPHVAQAFLAAEDRRFYRHGAVDPQGIVRAAVANLQAGRTVQGGSTLTQQLARTLFLRPEKTFKRKVQEVLLARELERRLTKDEILELYLNRIYFGDRAYGVSAAARIYFDKEAKALTLPEAALLAALPKAPTRLALTNDYAAAWTRAKVILAQMQALGWASPQQVAAVSAQAPAVRPPDEPAEGDMAWVLDAAATQAATLAGRKAPDLVVTLTIDPQLQAAGSEIVRTAVLREGRPRQARQGALVALAPDGAIRALVGGVDHSKSPFNRAWQARRQPGSAFKPFVWAAALEHGASPWDVRADAPVRIGGWSPQNFGGGYSGYVTLAEALRRSINTVAVRLTREVGPAQVAALARRCGLVAVPERPGPSIALGAYEVSLLELTSAYQVFQNGGLQRPPYLISRITNARGDVLYDRGPVPGAPALGRREAGQMVRMMQSVIGSGTGRRAAFGRIAAGKTGTSQNYRDAWFVGFTPDWAVGVWVGNDNNRPMARMVGGELPAIIWRRFMTTAHAGLPSRGFDWLPQLPPTPPPADEPAPDAEDEEPLAPFDVAEAPPEQEADWPPEPISRDAPEAWRPPTEPRDAEPLPEELPRSTWTRPIW